MRGRIVKSLQRAHAGERPTLMHEVKNYELSKKALEVDVLKGWNIIQSPEQLAIRTNDALCSQIVKMDPIHSTMGANIQITQDASEGMQRKRLMNLRYCVSNDGNFAFKVPR
jgi:hypothetical protein